MDQRKIGFFLKELRKEKNLTQEQLAEKMNVSGRTVSRWETGHNMPDISLLVELAEFYDVSIPEIIDGERKSESMEKEVKEVAEKNVGLCGGGKGIAAQTDQVAKHWRRLRAGGVFSVGYHRNVRAESDIAESVSVL